MAGRFDSILSGSLVFSKDGVFASSIVPHPNALTITGSVKISGSNLILNGSDVGLRITTLEAGQGADQVKFGAITLWTSSISEWTGSTNQYIANLNQVSGSLNLFTGSVESRVSLLEASSSLENVSSSLLDTRLTTIESKTLVSSSAQIDALGFLSSSITGIVSRSAQISDLGFITGSKYSQLEEIPGGILSSSAQIATEISGAGAMTYVTSSNLNLKEIKINDYDADVAATYNSGRLTLTFGTPAQPSSINIALSGFNTDRFNQTSDSYDINATWNNGGYIIHTASIYEGNVLLSEVNTGTSISFPTSSIGSHTYKLIYTASSPLDNSIYTNSDTVNGTLSKSNPAQPSLTSTPSVQLGYSSNQIEQGATGSITFTSSSSATSNQWELNRTETNLTSPYIITGSATGSSSISITATAYYDSPVGENSPDTSTTRDRTDTYTKIRSVRYGASALTTFNTSQLSDLAFWDNTIGGEVGTIDKGNTNPSGDSLTISWSGDKYHYIVYDSSRSNLSNITTSGFGVLGQFSVTTIGQYKVYKTNTLQAGGGGSSITYDLT
tara:strand:+ start:5591 stop:7258 length:1668 start_codon:yes stop_codon:yes gene_type:complete